MHRLYFLDTGVFDVIEMFIFKFILRPDLQSVVVVTQFYESVQKSTWPTVSSSSDTVLWVSPEVDLTYSQ